MTKALYFNEKTRKVSSFPALSDQDIKELAYFNALRATKPVKYPFKLADIAKFVSQK